MKPAGRISRINGPVVHAHLDDALRLQEQVWAGEAKLAGEVIALMQDEAVLQVYEETSGLRPGEPLFGSGELLSVTLGPGLIGSIYDGIQRRLDVLYERDGIFLRRGTQTEPLPSRSWSFEPSVGVGTEVGPGTIIGVTPETSLIEHRILVPPGIAGTLVEVAEAGERAPEAVLAVVRDADGRDHQLTMLHRWPVRRERPVAARLEPNRPLVTGQRVLDSFLPLTKGGTASMPGPFGSGKTVLQHALAKWCNAQVIVYVGCGERGNEIAQVLTDFPKLTDPFSGRPLMERTILVANTSDMPVAAREASVYTGITLAEYYRDQGYDVALIADSTSRWAEALREIAGRLEQMPAEEGFPAHLPSRVAAFYERAGRVRTAGGGEGSLTVIGAISPPGGDFTEPVTQHTQRATSVLWALDRSLASARHYPAINWQTSHSFYGPNVAAWWAAETGDDWQALRTAAAQVLEQDGRLEHLVRLVGPEALPDPQRWVLELARLIKEGFLQQNALHPVDAHCSPTRQVRLLRLFVRLFETGRELIDAGMPLKQLRGSLDEARLAQVKEAVPNERAEELDRLSTELDARLRALVPSGQGT